MDLLWTFSNDIITEQRCYNNAVIQ